MKIILVLIGGLLALLGSVMFIIAWFGPHSGDGFENVGQIMLGLPLALVGMVMLAVGMAQSGNPGEKDRNE
jgi:hypothetical protein